jgi:hypothetical protein
MSLITKRWSFSNGKESRIISAIYGPSAWRLLAQQVGEYVGTFSYSCGNGRFKKVVEYEIPLPHGWNIQCVCICGKAQHESFCSEVCFQRWKLEHPLRKYAGVAS